MDLWIKQGTGILLVATPICKLAYITTDLSTCSFPELMASRRRVRANYLITKYLFVDSIYQNEGEQVGEELGGLHEDVPAEVLGDAEREEAHERQGDGVEGQGDLAPHEPQVDAVDAAHLERDDERHVRHDAHDVRDQVLDEQERGDDPPQRRALEVVVLEATNGDPPRGDRVDTKRGGVRCQ